MIRLVLAVALLILPLFSSPLMAASEKSHVVMLLWRGVTDAERGFMDYLSSKVDVKFTVLDANRNKAVLTEHIRSIDTLDADLVYTFGTTVTLSLLGTIDAPTRFRAGNIPAVFSIVSDPIGSNIISEQPSSRNFTGVSHIVPHDVQFKSISKLDGIETIGVIYNPLENNSVVTAEKIMTLSGQYNKRVNLYPLTINQGQPSLDSIDDIVIKMGHDNVDLAYLPPDSFIISSAQRIVNTMHNHDIPTFSSTETPIRNSQALIGIVSRYYNVGQFTAYKAEQVLTSSINISNIIDIPIEPLSQYSYIVNITAAKQLDYYPPVSVLKISELIGNDSDDK